MENGKTLAELDVKAGDAVEQLDFFSKGKTYFVMDKRHPYGIDDMWLCGSKDGDLSKGWSSSTYRCRIIERATPQEPTPPRKMHPDDFMLAVSEFAADNGFGVTQLKFHGTELDGRILPHYSYSV
jgi:hypothetical protein